MSRVTTTDDGRNLTRFRVNPRVARIAIRKVEGDVFLVTVSGVTREQKTELAVQDAGKIVRSAIMRALRAAWDADIDGVDPYMEWAYEHPQFPKGTTVCPKCRTAYSEEEWKKLRQVGFGLMGTTSNGVERVTGATTMRACECGQTITKKEISRG